MMASELSKWEAVGPVGAQRAKLVEHSETGQQGFRAVRWINGSPELFGPVYSSPNCTSAEECREVGIPESEADAVLCG